MEQRNLGRSDLSVSLICLGSMTWGEQNSEQEAFAQLDCAVAHGINFIDVAEMYPVPPRAETQGRTETYLGNWLKARGRREDLVLATKVSGPGNGLSYLPGGPRLTRERIETALDGSLKRLQTDYIDLYQVHWPDRDCNFFGQLGYRHNPEEASTPIAETLDALSAQVKAGKIRHIGLSNETPWGTMNYLQLAAMKDQPRIVSIQNPYNLLNRSYEVAMAEISQREDVGLLAYSPLAFGVLTGKYLGGAKPAGARLSRYTRFQRYNSPQAEKAAQAYADLARQNGLSPAQLALAFVNSRSFLTSNIIGATSLAQLEANIASHEIRLSDTILNDIEDIHRIYTYPAP